MTIGEIKKIKEGSKTSYQVQFEKGRLTFQTLKVANKWRELLLKEASNEGRLI